MPFSKLKVKISDFSLQSFKDYILNSKGFTLISPSERGFTLIEILIAISIMSIVAFISVPNLKRFSEDQEIGNASGELITALRTAQNNDMSGIKCTKSAFPNQAGWSVQLTKVGTVYGYKLIQDCLNSASTLDQVTTITKTFPTNITFQLTKDTDTSELCTSLNQATLKFYRSILTMNCDSQLKTGNYFDIRITNTSTNNSKKIRIENGGSISIL